MKREKNGELTIEVLKARSFKKPDRGWSFTWNINEGILAPVQVGAAAQIDSAKAAAKAQDAMSQAKQQIEQTKQQELPDNYFDEEED